MSPALSFTALASLFAQLPIIWHFGTVFGYWGAPPATRQDLFIRIGIFIVFSIVASVVAAIAMAAATGDEDFEPDEREQHILRRAELTGYYGLAVGILVIMWFVFAPWTPMQTANALIGAFALSEVIKLIAGFTYLKLGA